MKNFPDPEKLSCLFDLLITYIFEDMRLKIV